MMQRPPRSTRTATLFPTRRSSDRWRNETPRVGQLAAGVPFHHHTGRAVAATPDDRPIALQIARLHAIGEHRRSEEHTSELQSLMRISYAVFCLKKKNTTSHDNNTTQNTHMQDKNISETYDH